MLGANNKNALTKMVMADKATKGPARHPLGFSPSRGGAVAWVSSMHVHNHSFNLSFLIFFFLLNF